MTTGEHILNLEDDLQRLFSALPDHIASYIQKMPDAYDIIEIILDLGIKVQFRFHNEDKRIEDLPEVTLDDIDFVVSKLGGFNTDNRAGIERTLHRISAIRNRAGKILGLTLRVGRAVVGSVEVIHEIISSGKNVLFVGPPGVGKTTKLREAARMLSVSLDKRVMIVDTSNEIAGEGDISHPGIGYARRMQVPQPDLQHSVMIEAVENHMPEVIIVDEIGTEEESKAARTIAERGVQLLATAHGHNLENVIKNPTLSDLLGGIQPVILGDEEAKFRGTQKTVLERKSLPTFDVLIELREWDVLAIYLETQYSVDSFLRGEQDQPEIRQYINGEWKTLPSESSATAVNVDDRPLSQQGDRPEDLVHIFPFGINKDKIYAAIHALQVPAVVAHSISQADIVLTPKSQVKAKSKINQILQGRQIPLHVINRNSGTNIMAFLKFFFKLTESDDDIEDEAIREAELFCRRVLAEKKMYELDPKPAYLRSVQHEIAEEMGLNSASIGTEPNRRLRIYPRD